MQVNVLNCEPKSPRGLPRGFYPENVSETYQNRNLKTGLLLLSVTINRKRKQNFNQKNVNVNKLLNDLKKRLISTITKRWWTFKEDYANVSEIKRDQSDQNETDKNNFNFKSNE